MSELLRVCKFWRSSWCCIDSLCVWTFPKRPSYMGCTRSQNTRRWKTSKNPVILWISSLLFICLLHCHTHPGILHTFIVSPPVSGSATSTQSPIHTDTSDDIMHHVPRELYLFQWSTHILIHILVSAPTYHGVPSVTQNIPIYTASWHTEHPKISTENWWGSNMA
jgi:hypothetical protein